jgi:hypothetical protein
MQIPPQPNSFLQQLENLLISFLVIVVPACAWWIVAQLKKNRATNQVAASNAEQAAANAANAAQAISDHNVTVTGQLNDIKNQTNGINTALQQSIDSKDKVIEHLIAVQKPPQG